LVTTCRSGGAGWQTVRQRIVNRLESAFVQFAILGEAEIALNCKDGRLRFRAEDTRPLPTLITYWGAWRRVC
jgi:hypothetical protein